MKKLRVFHPWLQAAIKPTLRDVASAWSAWSLVGVLLGATGGASSLQASPQRIGTFVARLELTAVGEASGSADEASWSDKAGWTLRSEVRREVVQINRSLYGDRDQISASSSENVSGGGSTSMGTSWSYDPNPSFNPSEPYVAAGTGIYSDKPGYA